MSEELKVITEVKKVVAWKDCNATILDGKISFAIAGGFGTFAEKELNSDPEGFLKWLTLVVNTLLESKPKPPRKPRSDKGAKHYEAPQKISLGPASRGGTT